MTVALSKLNFRDLGGLRTAGGRLVKSGVIYRSEGPASFFEEHRRELGALGVRCVCDLRSAGEREAAPNDWCGPGCRVMHLDMNTDLRVPGAEVSNALRTDSNIDDARKVIISNYARMPAVLSPHFSSIVGALFAGEVPMIVHCTAGKDRTGVAIALLLALLGVSRRDILSDYARSDVFGRNMRAAGLVNETFRKTVGFVPSEPVMAMMMGTHDDFLLAAFSAVEGGWGSVANYFAAGGIDSKGQDKLRARLLE